MTDLMEMVGPSRCTAGADRQMRAKLSKETNGGGLGIGTQKTT